MPYNFTAIEKKWQQHWLEDKTFRALDPAEAGDQRNIYVLDMFPYPSGVGLHVGHAEPYTASDIIARYWRMKGLNVLHPTGWDAFGLPAEQHAIKTNVHPRELTAQNIANFRRQMRTLGFSYDWDREVNTTDPRYYKWTQWIFLQLFNSYFDPIDQKARPIGHLMQELVNENLVIAPDGELKINPVQEGMEAISGETRLERLWRELSHEEQRDVIDGQRLAYMDDVPVNWCPGLGTVLANEEVIDGKSEVGGFPVERRPMRQWMLRITAYADRLLADLDLLEWPESLKEMQRNWIGRSTGAEVEFDVAPPSPSPGTPGEGRGEGTILPLPSGEGQGEGEREELVITVFTTRPDTLYGATYMVLAPEYPLVDRITPESHRETIEAYRTMIAGKSDRERTAETKDKTGVFTGAYAINPVNDEKIPIYIADYVLMGYGTGAIMAVPAHDERDFEFAKKFNLPIRAVVMPPDSWLKAAAVEFFRQAKPKLTKDGKPLDLSTLDPELRQKIEEAGEAARKRSIAMAESWGEKEFKQLRADYAARRGSIARAFTGDGIAINSPIIDGLPTPEAKETIIKALSAEGAAYQSVKYKLRDWLFSRQRYWGEPFPVAFRRNDHDRQYPLPIAESALPLVLPAMADFKPRTGEAVMLDTVAPLARNQDWVHFLGRRTRSGIVPVTPEEQESFIVSDLDLPPQGDVEVNIVERDSSGKFVLAEPSAPDTVPSLSNEASAYLNVPSDVEDFIRETNTMPQWAGSCWYYLRFCDPHNDRAFVDPEKEKYWNPVDLYVGGVEHAVLHLLYARFWHKVLYDLGHVSSPEPFMRLVNQGLILGEMEYHLFETADGKPISAADVRDVGEEATEAGVMVIGYHKESGNKLVGRRITDEQVERAGNEYRLKSNPQIRVDARSFKMSKSRGNVANPDDIVRDYGADALRLYVMYLGPLEAQKPWNTKDIVGMTRFLNSVWRNIVGEDEGSGFRVQGSANTLAPSSLNPEPRTLNPRVEDSAIPDALDRQMHRTIKKVEEDILGLRYNTAIAELIKLNNEMNKLGKIPRKLAENLSLMLAPFAPHIAEELWQRLGHETSLAHHPWPTYDEAKLVETQIEVPVQVNGKLRGRITIRADADEQTVLATAESAQNVRPWIEGKTIRKRVYVNKKLVNLVVS